MKLLGSSMSLLMPTMAIAIASIAMAVPFASAFTPTRPLVSKPSPSKNARFESSSSKKQRKRGTKSSLASSQREDLEDRLWSIRNSWKSKTTTDTEGNVFRSDVPTENQSDNSALSLAKEFKERFFKLPPPPEDQFVMTGDIAILFLYAFTSHSINDYVVKGLLSDPKMTIPEAVKELDPMHEIVSMQHPVWVDLASNPNVPFGNPAVERALEVSARESLMNHWSPLLSTEGTACVALCSCWLIAGWIHRAFLYDSTTYCSSDQALTKTVQTWLTSAMLLALVATGADWLVNHVPALQSIFCVTCRAAANGSVGSGGEFKAAMAATSDAGGLLQLPATISVLSLTQSDVLFIVDSLTVLLAWRWSANQILNIFR